MGKEGKSAAREALYRAAQRLSLPGEIVAGVARVEITGAREILIENHGGILEYGDSAIDINGGAVIIKIRGTELVIEAMTASELSIKGRIALVEFAE